MKSLQAIFLETGKMLGHKRDEEPDVLATHYEKAQGFSMDEALMALAVVGALAVLVLPGLIS